MTVRSVVIGGLTVARTAYTATAARVARLLGRRYFTARYFERRFERPDPWGFEHREYERVKYKRTLDALPSPRYARILEIGCAEGLLTESLAERGAEVVATDVSERALARARNRLAGRQHVRFARSDVFTDRLPGQFDLAVASEVLCFAESLPMLDATIERLAGCLEHGGHLVLVHLRIASEHPTGWPPVDLLFGADVIHRRAARVPALALLNEHWEDRYAISVYRRSAE